MIKAEVKWIIYLIGLGVTLVAYAHSTFDTKEEAKSMHEDIRELRKEVSEVKTILIEMGSK